jgi:hypothetical protein
MDEADYSRRRKICAAGRSVRAMREPRAIGSTISGIQE